MECVCMCVLQIRMRPNQTTAKAVELDTFEDVQLHESPDNTETAGKLETHESGNTRDDHPTRFKYVSVFLLLTVFLQPFNV